MENACSPKAPSVILKEDRIHTRFLTCYVLFSVTLFHCFSTKCLAGVLRGDRRWWSRPRDRYQSVPGAWTPVPGSCPVLSPGRLFPGSLFYLPLIRQRQMRPLRISNNAAVELLCISLGCGDNSLIHFNIFIMSANASHI